MLPHARAPLLDPTVARSSGQARIVQALQRFGRDVRARAVWREVVSFELEFAQHAQHRRKAPAHWRWPALGASRKFRHGRESVRHIGSLAERVRRSGTRSMDPVGASCCINVQRQCAHTLDGHGMFLASVGAALAFKMILRACGTRATPTRQCDTTTRSGHQLTRAPRCLFLRRVVVAHGVGTHRADNAGSPRSRYTRAAPSRISERSPAEHAWCIHVLCMGTTRVDTAVAGMAWCKRRSSHFLRRHGHLPHLPHCRCATRRRLRRLLHM